MKKILAVLLALAMLLGLAACGGNNEDTTTTTAEDTTVAEEVTEEAVGAEDTTVADEATTVADEATTVADEATTVADEATTVADEATTVADETTKAAATTAATTKASAGLNSTNAAEIADYYKAAVKKTVKVTDTEKMALAAEIGGDGFLGAVLGIIQPIIESVLADQGGTEERGIPGSDDGVARIKAEDIASAKATSNGGKTTIEIKLKGQVDGPDAPDGKTTGPVARAIGTLGNIDGALEELGATISEGRETVKLDYKNAVIKVVIDENTGKIIDGSWKYDIYLNIGAAKISMAGLNINAKNLNTIIAYSIEM